MVERINALGKIIKFAAVCVESRTDLCLELIIVVGFRQYEDDEDNKQRFCHDGIPFFNGGWNGGLRGA